MSSDSIWTRKERKYYVIFLKKVALKKKKVWTLAKTELFLAIRD